MSVDESKLKPTAWEESQIIAKTNSNFKTGVLMTHASSLNCSERKTNLAVLSEVHFTTNCPSNRPSSTLTEGNRSG